MIELIQPGRRMGVINVPASKSDAQRAILVAALVPDTSRVYNYGSSDDVKAMISCIQELGAICSLSEDFIEIRGLNIFPDKVCFNCGESGLSFRLLAALSMVLKGDFELHGRDSLLSRDHSFIEAFGLGRSVQVQSNNGQIPYIIKGRIEEEIYTIDAGITSQFLSGLLIALPLQGRKIKIFADKITSKPYLLMSLKTVAEFGVNIDFDGIGKFEIRSSAKYSRTNYLVEGDWSAASYWIVACLLGHELTIKGLSNVSFQADRSITKLLSSLGIEYDLTDGCFSPPKAPLSGFDFDATQCPDLFPALTALAVNCSGTSRIRGVHRLINKETDRSNALVSEFKKLGANIYIEDDVLCIKSCDLKGGVIVESHGDHRIAMCLAIAALNLNEELTINDADVVSKSYPMFWRDLNNLIRKKKGA